MRRLTDPQRKALFWLTPGAECHSRGRDVSAACQSLAFYHRDLVKAEWKVTPRGRRYLTYTLTNLGAKVRAEALLAEAYGKTKVVGTV